MLDAPLLKAAPPPLMLTPFSLLTRLQRVLALDSTLVRRTTQHTTLSPSQTQTDCTDRLHRHYASSSGHPSSFTAIARLSFLPFASCLHG